MRISASSSDVCSSDLYKTGKDLDGQPFTFHARGTGTETIGNLSAKREGIKFGQRSYVPGSENRIIAMMKGQINATVVDLDNKHQLMEMGDGKLHVLPGVSAVSSAHLVFANDEWRDEHAQAVSIVVAGLLKLRNDMKEHPARIKEESAA